MEYFRICDQIYGFTTLFCISKNNILFVNHIKTKQTDTKESLLTKQALSRMQENRFKGIPKSELVDVINEVCLQRYVKRLEQQTSDATVHTAELN